MKLVCMITQSPYPADPRVRRQAEVLQENGYEVDIICIPQKGQAKSQRYGLITAYRIMKDQRNETISRYVVQSFGFFLLAFIKLQKLSSKRKYDLIQIHNMPDSHVFTALIQKLSGTPVVLDIHDLTPELFESKWNGDTNKLILAIVKLAEKISCRFADQVITVTDTCKELLVKRGVPAEKITVILNTPDHNIFKFDNGRKFSIINRSLKLLYHGTVAERFGIHHAVEAFKIVNDKIPGSTFSVYGKYDDSYKERLIKLINKLGLESHVFLNGRRTLEEIYELIQKSDMAVVPYVNNLYMNLALSTKTFEYAAAGLPVVSTRLKTLAELLDDSTVTYAKPDNPADLAEKIIALCYDPDKRKIQTLNAHKALQSISWQVMAKRYLDLFDLIIEKSKIVHNLDIKVKNTKQEDYNKVV